MINSAKRGKRNRQRGQEGEREIVDLIREDFGIGLKGRRLGQERDGGHDVDLGYLRIQVKRKRRQEALYRILEAADVGCIRADGKDWLVLMRWPTFVRLAREEIAEGEKHAT